MDKSLMVRSLIRIGLTRVQSDGSLFVPFNAPPRHKDQAWRDYWLTCRFWGLFYIFRNLPHVVKWKSGRWLPRRWGFGIFGFEFGDRGGD